MANWFTRRFGPKNGPEEHRSISYQDYWGSARDLYRFSTNQATALQLVPVYAAVRLLADSVAQLPLQQFKKIGDTRKPMPLSPVFANPTLHGTTMEWVQRAMTSLTLRGNAYGFVSSFDNQGRPASVEWMHPDDIHPGSNTYMGVTAWYWNGQPIPTDRLIHIPNLVVPGEVLGLSPIKAYQTTVETGLLAQRFGRDWFQNGQIPAAVLQTDQKMAQDDSQRIKERFLQSSANREPVVLGHGLEYKPIAVLPEESQFLATQRLTVNQIASIYGIPPERIGGEAGNSLTYSNRDQDTLDFVAFTLGAYLRKLETAFNQWLPENEFVKFNTDAMLRSDTRTRYETYQLALDSGWMNVDEVRALEDMAPLPGGQGKQYGPRLVTPELEPAPARSISVSEVREAAHTTHLKDATDELARFFERQGAVVVDRLERSARAVEDILDSDKWLSELQGILQFTGRSVSFDAAMATMTALGLDESDFDQTEAEDWLEKHSRISAERVNDVTKEQVKEALQSDDVAAAVRHVFAVAADSRAPQIAQTEVTATSGFGVHEAGYQSGLELKKTWVVTSKRPRRSHRRINGETVRFKEPFSIGGMWPGHHDLDIDDRAGCTCDMRISPV